MQFRFQVAYYLRGDKSARHSPIVRSFDEALKIAGHLRSQNDVRIVTLLRADTEGVNADKFFLHQIIK